MPTNTQKTDVDLFLESETDHKRKALENASRKFDENDTFSVHTLEAIYGVESSFGTNFANNKRGSDDPAGHFQLDKKTAERYGLKVSKENDERYDIDKASAGMASKAKEMDDYFRKGANVLPEEGIKTIPISDPQERRKFAIAAVHAGEGRIARAQQLAKGAGKDPTKWDDVMDHLIDARATPEQAQKTKDYVEKVPQYEKEFSEKSKADKAAKDKPPKEMPPKGMAGTLGPGHWITKDGEHIFIED